MKTQIPVPFPYKTWSEFDADLLKRLNELNKGAKK